MSSHNLSLEEKKANIFNDLNDVQKEAVAQPDGPILIIAGAGSGKTRVLTRKIAHLLLSGVPAENILAVTFTRKAAGEIKERVRALVNQYVHIGTFHSVCLTILKEEAEHLGYSKNFSIYDDYDQLSLIKSCMEKAGLKESSVKPQSIAARIDRLKCDMIYPENFQQESSADESFYRVFHMYQQSLERNQIMDFNDLICKCIRLFRDKPAVLEKYQQRYTHILIDEYQDTNHAQYLFVNMLARKRRNICVVGDSDQSIYGFRGANMHNFLNFEKDFPDATVFKMEQNYRSTKNILNAANALIKNSSYRQTKRLWTEKDLGEKIVTFRGDTERNEALFIIDRIQQLIDQGYKARDIVIFYRVHALSRVIEEELVKEGLPYRIVGGTGFYQRREIKEVLALLKVVAFPTDITAIKRIIQIAGKGIGAVTVKTIENFADETNVSFLDSLRQSDKNPALKTAARKAVTNLNAYIEGLDKAALEAQGSIKAVVESIVKASGLMEKYKADDIENKTRRENIQEFFSAAAEYEQRESSPSLGDFLDSILISSEVDRMEEDSDCLTMMTLHGAKGLEFPVVFIMGLEEGLLPHINSLDSKKERDEERRLLYVGITRAHERLIFSSVSDRLIYGFKSYRAPSSFINDIPSSLIQKIEERIILDGPDDGGGNGYFDSTARKARKAKAAAAADSKYAAGMIILHPAFGPGKITAVSGEGDKTRLEICFSQSGEKKTVMPKYAKLTVVK